MLLTLILINTAIIRFFKISEFPPLKIPTDEPFRYLSAAAALLAVFLLYKITFITTNNKKIAYLTAFIFSILPWTIEQGRLVSEVNVVLSSFLFLIWVLLNVKGYKKLILLAGFPLSLYLLYPVFWLFQLQESYSLPSAQALIKNILFLTSTKLIFFENTTYWWGGVRLWGISYLVFAPFLVIGLIKLIKDKNLKLLGLMGTVLLIAASSPKLPESREFYFITPMLSFCITLGIVSVIHIPKNRYIRIAIVTALVCIFIYEYQNFLHFYMVHYAERVRGSLHEIHGQY